MNLIYLIKTLNLIALIFIPLNYVYAVLGYNNRSGLIYLWLCIVGFFINHYNKKKSKLIVMLILILFFILITSGSIEELIYLAVYCIMTILVIFRGMSVIKYDAELDIFRKGIYICIVTFIVSFILGGIQLFSIYSAYYVIIYLVTSILVLRNLRFIEYNKDSREGKRINNRYSMLIVVFSFILSISYVREVVIKIIKNSYLYITELFMYLFSWLFLGVGYLVSIAFNAIMALIKKFGINTQGLESISLANKIKSPITEEGEVLIDKLLNSQIFTIIIKAFVILLVAYIIMRLFKGVFNNESVQEEYWEEKEFILGSEEQGKYHRKRLFEFLKPKNSNEQIRLYYQKYLRTCIDRGIEITERDTTEEISNKSRIKFDIKLIDGIRNVYIKVRYGEKESTKEMVREMEEYVKKTKK